jgi:superkiller protein 3
MNKRPVVESAHITFTDHEISRRPHVEPATKPDTTKLKPLLSPSPNSAVAARNLGFAQLQVAGASGRSEFLRLAIQTLEPVQQADVADAEFWENLGGAYIELPQTAKAEAAFGKATDLDPKLAAPYYALGFLYQTQRLFTQAIASYHKAVGFDPDMAEAWANLASAYLETGKRTEAIKSLEAALRLEPGNLGWRRALEAIKAASVP